MGIFEFTHGCDRFKTPKDQGDLLEPAKLMQIQRIGYMR